MAGKEASEVLTTRVRPGDLRIIGDKCNIFKKPFKKNHGSLSTMSPSRWFLIVHTNTFWYPELVE